MALEDGNIIILASGNNVAPEPSVVLREDLANALNESVNRGEGSWNASSEHADSGYLRITGMEPPKAVAMDYNWHKIILSEIKKDPDDDIDIKYPTSN